MSRSRGQKQLDFLRGRLEKSHARPGGAVNRALRMPWNLARRLEIMRLERQLGKGIEGGTGFGTGAGPVAVVKAIGKGVKPLARGAHAAANVVVAPGGVVARGVTKEVDRIVTLPGFAQHGVGLLPAATLGLGTAFAAASPNIPLVADPSGSLGPAFANTYRLNSSGAAGAQTMSDPFQQFKQAKIDENAPSKTASNVMGLIGNKGVGAMEGIARKLLLKTDSKDVLGELSQYLANTGYNGQIDREALESAAEAMGRAGNVTVRKNMRGGLEAIENLESISLPKALGVGGLGAAAVGLGVADDVMGSNALSPLGYQSRRDMFGLGDRVEADETFAKSFLQQSGKETASLLSELVSGTVIGAQETLKGIPRGNQQMAQARRIIQEDDLLSQASENQKDMLGRAYNSMQRIAPSLADDEFATRNFLRESLMASNGPDYGTLGNMARAERDITGRK